ncbi:hypothetical protein [Trichlorobacter sp.]|uniref:hypothetical protein n=1 Tax=Trichlorobacter sp. TaxID=2911007 RepID=UPI002A35DDA3|nr:hypothetical protein [Trichlorobacter sp.]MDY0384728.1 hypothetical protein [Trichlorobacter sp.]
MNEKDQTTQILRATGINPHESRALSDGCIEVEPSFDLSPEDFIRFAELDLAQDDERSLVNALGNAKRAIDCRTDIIISALKLSPKRLKLSKLSILKEIGALAPRILNKVRSARNLLEHEYVLPTRELVEDAVDVAMLFEAAAHRVLHLFPEVIYIYNNSEKDGVDGHLFQNEINITFTEGGYKVSGYKNCNKMDIELLIPTNSSLYFVFTKLYVSTHVERGIDAALKELYEKVEYL